MHFSTEAVLSIISKKALVGRMDDIGSVLAWIYNCSIPLPLLPLAAGVARDYLVIDRPEFKDYSEPGDISATVDDWVANAKAVFGDSIELERLPQDLRGELLQAIAALPVKEELHFVATQFGIKKIGSGSG